MSAQIRKYVPEVKPEPPEQEAKEKQSLAEKLEAMSVSNPEKLEQMKKEEREAVFVLPQIALSGNITLINAEPNAGKTLLTCWLLSERCRDNDLKVFYINADDTFSGGIFKAEFMMSHDVQMLIPGQGGFGIELLPILMEQSIDDGTASGVVFVLDTLKKVVDPMDKTAARKANDTLRRFVASGGTVVALAHVNKHKDGLGNSVAEGVGDFKNDFDAAYLLEIKGDRDDEVRTVAFHNTKSRGPNARHVVFTYSNTEGETWKQRLDSVVHLTQEEAYKREGERKLKENIRDDKHVIKYLEGLMMDGEKTKTELTQHSLDNGIARGTRERVLDRYSNENTGGHPVHWITRKGAKNSRLYRLPDHPPEEIPGI